MSIAMIFLSLLAPLFFVPGLDQFETGQIWSGDQELAIDLHTGSGAPIHNGLPVTLEFVLKDGLGRVLADSRQRGMSFRFALGDHDVDPLLGAAMEGMKIGGTRRVFFDGDFVGAGMGSIVPPKTDLVLWLRAMP